MKKLPERLSSPGERLLLMLLALLLLTVALAKPALELPRNTYDFMFTLDITGSMNVADVGPDEAPVRRLAYARQLVGAALAEMPCGSRAGLAVFTEHRTFLLFAPVEICDNHLVIASMLEKIDGRMAWAARSEVAKGLYAGIEAITALATMDGESRVGDTHLVFLTDGHEAPPVHPALRPKFQGQVGETGGLIAGIGGSTPLPIPYLDENDEVIGYWARDEVLQVDRHSLGRPSTQGQEAMAGIDQGNLQERIASGTEHLSSLRESYLQQLAEETGLEYLRATGGDAFARALLDPEFATPQTVMTNVARLPAALSLLCLMWLFGAPLWRRRVTFAGSGPRRGRLARGDAVPRRS